MDKIKKNDLAIVVKYPCCQKDLGHILRVDDVTVVPLRHKLMVPCEWCNKPLGPLRVVVSEGERCWPEEWLKKIPPIAETDEIHIQEEEKING